MTKSAALIILLGFVSAVSQPTATLAQRYLPLNVGNRWIYQYTATADAFETADGVIIWRTADGEFLIRDTQVPISESEFAEMEIVSHCFEPDIREGIELVVEQREDHLGQTYFRMNTGQLLRESADGSIHQFDEASDAEQLLLDVPRALDPDDDAALRIGQILPFNWWRPFGRPFASESTKGYDLDREARISTLIFSHSDGHDYCGVALGSGVGIVSVQCGNDVATEGYKYVLTSASVAGVTLPTATEQQTWGQIKDAPVRQ
jgi:hypothetical protein